MVKKSENVLDKKNPKTTKRCHVYKGYASSCDVGVLNSFNPILQLKSTNLQ